MIKKGKETHKLSKRMNGICVYENLRERTKEKQTKIKVDIKVIY